MPPKSCQELRKAKDLAHAARLQLVARKGEPGCNPSSPGGIGKREALARALLPRAASVKMGKSGSPTARFSPGHGLGEARGPEKTGNGGAGKPGSAPCPAAIGAAKRAGGEWFPGTCGGRNGSGHLPKFPASRRNGLPHIDPTRGPFRRFTPSCKRFDPLGHTLVVDLSYSREYSLITISSLI